MIRSLLAAILLAAITSTAAGDPKTDYLLYCRGCHLADGTSVPPAVPTLIDEVGKIVALPGGREYIVRVPGVAQTDMSDAELAAVLNWVLTEFNASTVAQDFEPYTAEYVRVTRQKVLEDPLRYRERLLRSAR